MLEQMQRRVKENQTHSKGMHVSINGHKYIGE